MSAAGSWRVYILKCADGTLYCGVTTDLVRRVREHNGASGEHGKNAGAKYTRTRRPVKLVHSETFRSRATAQAREYALKKLPRAKKLALIRTGKVR